MSVGPHPGGGGDRAGRVARPPRLALAAASLAAICALSGILAGPARPQAANAEAFEVLVFSRTTSFRHLSIPFGVEAVREIGAANGFAVEATEDQTQFRGPNLRRFEAVVFLNTTGEVLDKRRKRSFRRYVRRGGGYVGIHSAADTEHGWPFYGRLVGAYFKSHPIQQTGTFLNEARDQPATGHLGESFETFDEFYSFATNPRPSVRVLLSIDESSYSQDPNTTNLPGNTPASGVMGDHPMSWCHDNEGGRSFYTALGHENYLYELDWYRRHLLGGILTAARQVAADCTPD